MNRRKITAKIGVSGSIDDGEEMETFIKTAGSSLLQAKEAGRNTVIA